MNGRWSIALLLASAAVLLSGLALAPEAARAELNCNAGIEWYPDNGIRRCELNGHHTLYTAKGERVTCADGHELSKHHWGRLESCTLAAPESFGGVRCEKGPVRFDPEGNLVECRRL